MSESFRLVVILIIMAARPIWLTNPPARDAGGRPLVLLQSDIHQSRAEAEVELARRIAAALPLIRDVGAREALVQARFVESIAVGESLRYRASALIVQDDSGPGIARSSPWVESWGIGIILLGAGGLVLWLIQPRAVSQGAERSSGPSSSSYSALAIQVAEPGDKESPQQPREVPEDDARSLHLACGTESLILALGERARIARAGALPLAFSDLGDFVWSASGWRLKFSAYALQQARLGQDRYQRVRWRGEELELKSLEAGLALEPGVLVLALGSLAEQRLEVLRAEPERAMLIRLERAPGSGLEEWQSFVLGRDCVVLGPRPAPDVDLALGLDFFVFRQRRAGGIRVASRTNTEIRVKGEAIGQRALEAGVVLEPGALRILRISRKSN